MINPYGTPCQVYGRRAMVVSSFYGSYGLYYWLRYPGERGRFVAHSSTILWL